MQLRLTVSIICFILVQNSHSFRRWIRKPCRTVYLHDTKFVEAAIQVAGTSAILYYILRTDMRALILNISSEQKERTMNKFTSKRMETIKKIGDYEKAVRFRNDIISAIPFVACAVIVIFTGFNTLSGTVAKYVQRVERQQKGKRLSTILYVYLSFSPSYVI